MTTTIWTIVKIGGGFLTLFLLCCAVAGLVYWRKKQKKSKGTTIVTRTILSVWKDKRQSNAILSIIAFGLFWICLVIFFPSLAGLAKNWKLILAVLGVITIIGFVNPKGATFVTFGLLLLVFVFGIFGQLANENRLPSLSVQKEAVAKVPDPVTKATSSSITLTSKDGWVPIRVFSNSGKSWVANINPTTAVVTIRTPDGQIHKGGYGYEDDVWPAERKPQTWFIATDEDSPVAYTVTWAD